MDDLVDFLNAQFDEDERVARGADVKQGDPHWWVSPVQASGGVDFTVRSGRDYRPIARVQRLDGDEDEPAGILDGAAVAEHIARWDPDRVLDEIAAKREVLAKYHGVLIQAERRPHDEGARGYEVAMSHAVLALAQPFAGRPGWRPEWATEVTA